MAGNARFGLTSGSVEHGFTGNYPNVQRGNYPTPSLDRSGSSRDGGNNRIFGSGTATSRASGKLVGDYPLLSQYLMLDPIVMGDQKYTRLGELRRVLGFSTWNISEKSSFGAAYSKSPPPVAFDEVKRYKASVMDGSIKARGRTKKLDEHLHKLNEYFEVINSKKQQCDELPTNERSVGSNLKMGVQIHRNPPDLVTQRLEDRAKNGVLNKRVRTSVAEARPEGRSNGLPRQPQVMAKDRDVLKDNGAGSGLVEEKIRRLPAGGEGWDRKMKRKRSVGATFTRPIDSDVEFKRAMHHKLSSGPGLQSSDAGLRSGSSTSNTGINKLDCTPTSASSNARATYKNEQDKAAFPRNFKAGLNKEKLLAKGNNKLSGEVAGHSTMAKGKASRTLRIGSVATTNPSLCIPHVSEALDSWEQPLNVNKIHSIGAINNHKRALASGSSSPPMAQWVGQRPHKNSRTRRANLVSPVSNINEMQIPSEGCSPCDFNARITSGGTNDSLLSRGVANGIQQFKVKLENVSLPARLCESEESGAGESRSKEKGEGSVEVEEKDINAAQIVGSSLMLTNKSKLLPKEDIGHGVRRKGRSGRGSSFSRASISPITEKLESAATTKPLQSSKSGSDKRGSKCGRPLKKLSDRKDFSRLGQTTNSSSPDLIEPDDDREELLAAANFACNANYLACSNLFWKKMEPIFASVSSEGMSYLSQQLKLAEELHDSLSQMFGHDYNILGDDFLQGEISASDTLVAGERDRSLQNQVNLNRNVQNADTLCRRLDSETRFNKVSPLYQRVLSALIVEDKIEEFEENDVGRNIPLHCATDDSFYDAFPPTDAEIIMQDRMDFEYESTIGVRTKQQFTRNSSFCNGNTTFNERLCIQNHPCNDKMLKLTGGSVHSNVGVLSELSANGLGGPPTVQTKKFSIPSVDCQYEHMCLDDKLLLELQSIGICPETVPDLDEGDDEMINQEIIGLKKGLSLQIGKKKACLEKINNAIQGQHEVARRNIEQVAMNRLVELTHRKQLATRGSSASKIGVAKVSKQVALAFTKRTLARCHKFEISGASCFSEPALRDALFAAPHQGNEAEFLICVGPGVASNENLDYRSLLSDPTTTGSFPGSAEWHEFPNKVNRSSLDRFETSTHNSDVSCAKNGPASNRGKKKELLLDDVGGSAALRNTTPGSNLLGGTKGRRSERERDKDTSTRNAISRTSRPSLGNVKGVCKTKTKPKQKTTQVSTSGNGFVSKFTGIACPVYPSASVSGESVLNISNRKRELGLVPPGNNSHDSSKEVKEQMDLTNLQLHELDSLEELGGSTDINGPQDINTWFNLDGLQDHDSMGLEIPMDDLSELNMF